MFLIIGTSIGRVTVFVQPSLITDTYRVSIETAGMRTGAFQRPERLYIPILTDIKMITCAGEAPAQVVCCQVVFRIAAVATGGGTVNNDEVDKSHSD